MAYDDDPNNDGGGNSWREIVKVIVVLVAVALLAYMALGLMHKAFGQGYLPPRPYVQNSEDPVEYYAEDWVVLDQNDKLICRDPYIKRDIHVVKCIGRDPVR